MDLSYQNFQKLLRLFPEPHDMAESNKLVVASRPDVNVDMIERPAHRLVLRLSHYLDRVHGAAIPDPDMTLDIYLLAEIVGVLTYRDCFGFRKVSCPELMALAREPRQS